MASPITLITGTRTGIGKYLVEHYLKKGHTVIGCSRSAPDWELNGYEHFEADVSDEKAVKKVFSAIRKKHGRLDNLINNAGIASMNHFLLTPLSTMRKVIDTNLFGSFIFTREASKLMKKNSYGRIVNFTSVAVHLRLEGEAVYAASKAAIHSMTQISAREMAEFGITINTVAPTPIKTDLIAGVPEEKLQALLNRQAIHRYGVFEDVSNVIDFFIAPSSSFITGQEIVLGGIC